MPKRKSSKRKVPYEKGVPSKYLKNKKILNLKLQQKLKELLKLIKKVGI